MTWLRGLFFRKAQEQSLDAELRFHLEQQLADNIASGMHPDEARRRALVEFGGLDQIKEQCRDERKGRWIEAMWRDVRFGVRSLGRSPGFTGVAIATLALSLGANTAIFSFVQALFLQPLPYSDPDSLVTVMEKPPDGGRNGISTLNFLDWQRRNTCFEYLAGATASYCNLTGAGEPVGILGGTVSAHFFDVLRVKAVLGRTFVDGDDRLGHEHVVILSNGLWRSQFGGDRGIIGREIRLDGESYTVVGVLPKDIPLERSSWRIWRPLAFKPENLTRDFHWFWAAARLKPGVTLAQARSQMDAISTDIARAYPKSNRGWGASVERWSDNLVSRDTKISLLMLLGAVGLVLLVACVNFANLSLLRVLTREREVAIRISLGAGRWTLARQFMTESLLLSMTGGVIGIGLAGLFIAALKAIMPAETLPEEAVIGLNFQVILCSLFMTVLTGGLIGLLPAWQAGRPTLTEGLKRGGFNSSSGQAGTRARAVLVVVEIGLAFLLVASAGLLIRSLSHIMNADTGVDSTHVLAGWFSVPKSRYPSSIKLNSYRRQVIDRVGALPGVTDVAFASVLPFQGWAQGMPYQISGRPAVDYAHRKVCDFKQVSADYFHALRMRLLAGRLLAASDVQGMPPVMVINETMEKQEFPDGHAVGKHVLGQSHLPGAMALTADVSWEVVGVVADEQIGGLDNVNPSPVIYVTYDQSPDYGGDLVIRSDTDPALVRKALANAIHQIDPDQVVPAVGALDWVKNQTLGNIHYRDLLMVIFAGFALLLSAIGIYGVISYTTKQRTREIGIRMALGATPRDISRLVLRSGGFLIACGLAVGLAGSFALSRLLSSMLFKLSSHDPLTLAAATLMLTLVAIVACLLPAGRAAKLDPILALRSE